MATMQATMNPIHIDGMRATWNIIIPKHCDQFNPSNWLEKEDCTPLDHPYECVPWYASHALQLIG